MATQNDSAVDFIYQNDSSNSSKQFMKQEGATTSTPISSICRLSIIYDIATVTVGVFGILTNLISGVVFIAYRPLRRRMANYFLFNQSLIDLLSGFFLIVSFIVVYGETIHPPDVATCAFWNSKTIFMSLHVASGFNLVALTFERYAEIVHPIKHKLWITKRKIMTSIVFTWLIGFALKFSIILPTTKVVNGSCFFGVVPNHAFVLLVWAGNLLIEYLLPIFAIATCYILMARSFRRRVQMIPMPNSQDNSRIRMNIFKTLFLVVVCMALCLLLRQCIGVVFAFRLAKVDVNGVLFNVSFIISYLNCSVNPFIYLFKHQQFKKGFRQVLCRCRSSRIATESVDKDSLKKVTAF